MPTSVPSIRIRAGYLHSATFDHIFIFGILALAMTSGLAVVAQPDLFPVVLFLDLWLLGYHHVISTYTKLLGTREDRAENKFLIYKLPFIVLALVSAGALAVGSWLIFSIYFFWQWYHYTRQSYGVSAFYRRKADSSSATPPLLDLAAIWAIPTWGLLYRCSQQWDTFLYSSFWTPNIPSALVDAVGIVAVLIVSAWLIAKIIDFANGRLSYGQFAFLISHHTAFYFGYVHIENIDHGWLVANIWHNSQYILFVWLYNQNKFSRPQNQALSPTLYWLSQSSPVRIFCYFSMCFIATSLFYYLVDNVAAITEVLTKEHLGMATATTLIAYQTINFHHYVVDSKIWKARKKSLQQVMKIEN